MVLVSMLVLGSITGAIYSVYLLHEERAQRLARLMDVLSQESRLAEALLSEPTRGRLFSAVGPLHRFLPETIQESYGERLKWAGHPFGLDRWKFVSLKLLSTMLFPAITLLVSLFDLRPAVLTAMLLTGILGFVLPDLWLRARVADRKAQTLRELPLVADLIATAVSSGLSLTESVRRVAQDAPGLVSREFLRSVQEMATGKPRMEAWRDVMDRLPGEELRTIVTAIMQAEQNGTSVADILRYQVQQIRTFKQQEAQKIAQSVMVRMRIPMLLLILFPFMVVLLGPALMQISQLLRKG